MTPNEYALQKQKRFQGAMAGLVADNRFAEFIDAVREYREAAIESLTDPKVIKSERTTCAVIGEAAAYKSIIAIYDEFRKRGAPESS